MSRLQISLTIIFQFSFYTTLVVYALRTEARNSILDLKQLDCPARKQ